MQFDAVLIAGPTASGKSAAASALAEIYGGTVINADSMQVYRELRLLSARPSEADEARVPHCLYGHVSAHERYSAGRYQLEAADALSASRSAGRLPIFTGGTGLYFSALTEGLSPIPAVPLEVREGLRARQVTIGVEAFFAELAAQDPTSVRNLTAADSQRVLRAASVLAATGRPLSHWHRSRGIPVLEGLRIARFVIAPPREELGSRIDARFLAMVEGGALDEVRSLADLDATLPAARALGVRQLLRVLDGSSSLDDAVSVAQGETRRYAKRQMTWFRRFMRDWDWIEKSELSNIILIVKEIID